MPQVPREETEGANAVARRRAQPKRNRSARDRAAVRDAHLESDLSAAGLSKDAAPTFSSRVRIQFHHFRRRLADPDGLSVKAAIDALVASRILGGDTAQEVAEVSHIQTKIGREEEEKTIVTITRVQ